MRRSLEIMDTTLRDGEQTSGVSYSPKEKLTIAKLLIEELIKSEDESNPLSDEYLKHELKKKFKVNLARRTIAKYRLDLRIPPSNKRLKDLSN